MSGDPIEEYLARLRASLRTPPDRTGYFPLFAAICMLIFGPIVVILTAIIIPAHNHTAFAIPALAAVVGSIAMALAYTVQMVRTVIRQGRDAGTTDREGHYA